MAQPSLRTLYAWIGLLWGLILGFTAGFILFWLEFGVGFIIGILLLGYSRSFFDTVFKPNAILLLYIAIGLACLVGIGIFITCLVKGYQKGQRLLQQDPLTWPTELKRAYRLLIGGIVVILVAVSILIAVKTVISYRRQQETTRQDTTAELSKTQHVVTGLQSSTNEDKTMIKLSVATNGTLAGPYTLTIAIPDTGQDLTFPVNLPESSTETVVTLNAADFINGYRKTRLNNFSGKSGFRGTVELEIDLISERLEKENDELSYTFSRINEDGSVTSNQEQAAPRYLLPVEFDFDESTTTLLSVGQPIPN